MILLILFKNLVIIFLLQIDDEKWAENNLSNKQILKKNRSDEFFSSFHQKLPQVLGFKERPTWIPTEYYEFYKLKCFMT